MGSVQTGRNDPGAATNESKRSRGTEPPWREPSEFPNTRGSPLTDSYRGDLVSVKIRFDPIGNRRRGCCRVHRTCEGLDQHARTTGYSRVISSGLRPGGGRSGSAPATGDSVDRMYARIPGRVVHARAAVPAHCCASGGSTAIANAAPTIALLSQSDDVVLAKPVGPPIVGFASVAAEVERVASMFVDGEPPVLDEVGRWASDDLGYVDAIEHARVKRSGSKRFGPMDLRVTTIFRRESDGWRVCVRHADRVAGLPTPTG